MVEVSGVVPCALEAWEGVEVAAVAVTAQHLTKVTPEGVVLEAEGATTETNSNSCGKFIRVHADSFQIGGHTYLARGPTHLITQSQLHMHMRYF